MIKKNGFTLVELLAAIVILAIIALISVPTIAGLIEDARYNALFSDAGGIKRAVAYKLGEDDNYDVNVLSSDNIGTELDISSGDFDAVGVENNNGLITVTVIKNNMIQVISDDQKIMNAKVYGLSWDGTSTFTRTDDAVDLNVVEVAVGSEDVDNDFDSAEIYSEMVEVTDDAGNKFIKIPKFFIKKTVNGNAWKWQISKTMKDEDYYLPACFVDETSGKVLPYILVGKYNASLSVDNKLESKSGTIPLDMKTITEFRNYAKANGAGYQLLDIHIVDVLQVLFYIEFAKLDSSSIMQGFVEGEEAYYDAENNRLPYTITNVSGNTITLTTDATVFKVGQMVGITTDMEAEVKDIANYLKITTVNGNDITYEEVLGISNIMNPIEVGDFVQNVAYVSGTTDDITNATSGSMMSNSDGENAMMYRGIENLYGNIHQYVDGINIQNYQPYVAKNADNYISDKFDGDYVKLGYTVATGTNCVARMGFDKDNPFMQLAITVGSCTNNVYGDLHYPRSSDRIATISASFTQSYLNGLSLWRVRETSTSYYSFTGGRLVKVPTE